MLNRVQTPLTPACSKLIWAQNDGPASIAIVRRQSVIQLHQKPSRAFCRLPSKRSSLMTTPGTSVKSSRQAMARTFAIRQLPVYCVSTCATTTAGMTNATAMAIRGVVSRGCSVLDPFDQLGAGKRCQIAYRARVAKLPRAKISSRKHIVISTSDADGFVGRFGARRDPVVVYHYVA